MVQTLVNLSKGEDKIVNVVKASFGLKNKNDAVRLIVQEYEKNLFEKSLQKGEADLKSSLNPEGEKLEPLDGFEKNLGYA